MSEEATEKPLPALYACHRCRRIGPLVTALGHQYATGHVSEQLSEAVTLGIRQTWASEGRSLIDGADLPSKPAS